MATQAELRQRVLDRLYDNSYAGRPKLQRLAGAVADQDTDTVITVDAAIDLTEGDIIEFSTGEQALVWDIAGSNITVIRAQNGTASEAAADNSFIKINPKWTIKQVDDALEEAVADMAAQQLFVIKDGTAITLVAGQSTYPIAETDIHPSFGVLAVWYEEATSLNPVGLPFRYYYDPQGQEFAGNKIAAVRLGDWGNNGAGDTLLVTYAQLPTLGSLPVELDTAAVSYAVGRLFQAAEGPRIHDPGRHTDRTVQPGQGLRDGSFWMANYQREVWRYRAALNAKARDLPGAKWRRSRRFRKG